MRTATVVDLPDGDPIDCRDLVQAIAGAFVPVPENGASAMACIAGKILHVTAAGSWQEAQQADLFGKNSSAPTLFAQSQLDLPEPTVHELYLPMQLTREEIAWLRSVLDDLPSLRWPVSEARRIEFLNAYRRAASDKNWEPNVFTPGEVELRRRRQAPLVDAHWEALQAACSERSVRIFDRTGIVLKRLHPGLGCFITRREAKSYLEQRGLVFRELADGQACNQDGAHVPPSSSSAKPVKRQGTVGKPRLTPEERVAIVKLYFKLKTAGEHAYTEKTAAEYGVSTRTVSTLVKKAEEDSDVTKGGRIDRLLAGSVS
ncbi:phage transcriptional regulator AlpA [Burkholderia pseudomallei]|nr:phage transcriptional regulator AlpA [Burkholderia pseudomallei]